MGESSYWEAISSLYFSSLVSKLAANAIPPSLHARNSQIGGKLNQEVLAGRKIRVLFFPFPSFGSGDFASWDFLISHRFLGY